MHKKLSEKDKKYYAEVIKSSFYNCSEKIIYSSFNLESNLACLPCPFNKNVDSVVRCYFVDLFRDEISEEDILDILKDGCGQYNDDTCFYSPKKYLEFRLKKFRKDNR